jgi:hypothetical protein
MHKYQHFDPGMDMSEMGASSPQPHRVLHRIPVQIRQVRAEADRWHGPYPSIALS